MQAGARVWYGEGCKRKFCAHVLAHERQSSAGIAQLTANRADERCAESEYVFKGIVVQSTKWYHHGWKNCSGEVRRKDLQEQILFWGEGVGGYGAGKVGSPMLTCRATRWQICWPTRAGVDSRIICACYQNSRGLPSSWG